MNLTNVIQTLAALKDIDAGDVLGTIGLERRRSVTEKVLATLGIFGAGLVLGAGVGLLASPVAPAEVRKRITDGAKTVKNEIGNLVDKGEEVANSLKAQSESKLPSSVSSYKNGTTAS